MSDDTSAPTGASTPAPGVPVAGLPASARRSRLATLARDVGGCLLCPQLVAGRTQVVFGAGDPDADLMIVGEAPSLREDELGVPFPGAAGKLLDELLASIGLRRDEVFVTTVLKCRPPGNRDPAPAEIARCASYLHEQIDLVEPRVICSLGEFATRLLRGEGGIRALHGRPEIVTVGRRAVHLLPLFHPAAALYTRTSRATLEVDVAALPELLARPAPPQPVHEPEVEVDAGVQPTEVVATPEPEAPVALPAAERPDEQLGLF